MWRTRHVTVWANPVIVGISECRQLPISYPVRPPWSGLSITWPWVRITWPSSYQSALQHGAAESLSEGQRVSLSRYSWRSPCERWPACHPLNLQPSSASCRRGTCSWTLWTFPRFSASSRPDIVAWMLPLLGCHLGAWQNPRILLSSGA